MDTIYKVKATYSLLVGQGLSSIEISKAIEEKHNAKQCYIDVPCGPNIFANQGGLQKRQGELVCVDVVFKNNRRLKFYSAQAPRKK